MSATTEERKKYLDKEPMETFANQVINSIQLKLSPAIQAQYDKVKAESPDMSLVDNFAPLKWDVNSHHETDTQTKLRIRKI